MAFPGVPPGEEPSRGEPAAQPSVSRALPGPWRYLPHALVATFATVALPIVAVATLQAYAGMDSPFLAIALALILSLAAVGAGMRVWERRPGGRDLLFGDLMLWGWVRRVRTERRLAEATRTLGRGGAAGLERSRQVEVIEQVVAALEDRDSYTHGHSRRVARHAHAIAVGLGLSAEQVAKVRTAAAVHDVGKVETPREILNKPGKLTDREFAVIKQHPVAGAEMIAALGDPEITAMVRHHHERTDGTGYPDRIGGEDIPVGARIIAVADTFDALTSARSYRSARKQKVALEILRKEAGIQLDAAAVAAFLDYYSGRRDATRSTTLLAVPQGILSSVGGAVAPLATSAVAAGAAAVIGTSLVTPALPLKGAGEQAGGADRSPAATSASGSGGASGSGSGRGSDRSGDKDRPGSRGEEHASKPGVGSDGEDTGSVAGERAGSGSGPGAGPGSGPGTGPGSGSGSPGSGDAPAGSPGDRGAFGGTGPPGSGGGGGGGGGGGPVGVPDSPVELPGVPDPPVDTPSLPPPPVELPPLPLPPLPKPPVDVPGPPVNLPGLP